MVVVPPLGRQLCGVPRRRLRARSTQRIRTVSEYWRSRNLSFIDLRTAAGHRRRSSDAIQDL